MNVIILERFDKEEEKLKNKALSKQIENVIRNLFEVENIHDIPSLKRLKGAAAYRIRVGDYRLGITIEDNTITFHSIGHRKRFYDSFP